MPCIVFQEEIAMSTKFTNEPDDLYIERPPLTVFCYNELDISSEEYMRIALDVAEKSGILLDIKESSNGYRFDFYLHEALITREQVAEWRSLMGGSELYFVSVCSEKPETIRVSFYHS